ncbi:MAG TPA: DUF4118 domain-containing protein, partial [Candidatus Angelobacter sp.]
MTIKQKFLSLQPRRLSGFRPTAVTLLATGLAAALSLAAVPAIYATPYMLFSGAVIVSVWFGSFRYALLSLTLGGLFVNFFLRPPYGQFSLTSEELVRGVVWMVMGGACAFLVERLRASEDRSRKVLAGIAEGFFILDRDWNVIYANESAAKVTGRPAREVTGGNCWE